MHSLLQLFAASEEGGPAIHITPGELFKIGELGVTNSMFYGVIVSIVILILLITAARKMTIRPKRGFIQFIEIGTDFIMGTIESSMGSRRLAVKYAPFFASAFFFVLFTNWFGLLPGVGEALTYNGQPVFRPFTADLNGTLAASIVMMVLVQVFALRENGIKGYIRHFFAGSLKNPATYLLGVFEMVSELIRVGSLALRLFLNVAIGESILVIFAYLGSFVAPITTLPILVLELFVGALQAYIFTMLTIMYLSATIKRKQDEEETVQAANEVVLSTVQAA